jgi:hypothetical protein
VIVTILWSKLNFDNIYQSLGNQKHKDVVNLMWIISRMESLLKNIKPK